MMDIFSISSEIAQDFTQCQWSPLMISQHWFSNGLVPSGSKPLPEPILTQIYVAISGVTRQQWVKSSLCLQMTHLPIGCFIRLSWGWPTVVGVLGVARVLTLQQEQKINKNIKNIHTCICAKRHCRRRQVFIRTYLAGPCHSIVTSITVVIRETKLYFCSKFSMGKQKQFVQKMKALSRAANLQNTFSVFCWKNFRILNIFSVSLNLFLIRLKTVIMATSYLLWWAPSGNSSGFFRYYRNRKLRESTCYYHVWKR